MMYSNLLPPQDRIVRHEEKKRTVLRFLRQHIWSSQDILQSTVKIVSRQAAHKMLTSFEKEGLIRRHSFPLLVGKLTLWGITPHGQAMAFQLDAEEPVKTHFEPSRVSEQKIYHHLDLQRLRLKAESEDWDNWVDGNRLGEIPKHMKRPDAIATDPQGHISAIECERTLKTSKRYSVILSGYLQEIKSGRINRVIWVSPSPDISARLKSIILRIKSVVVASQHIIIDPNRHHSNLYFCDYSQWPQI